MKAKTVHWEKGRKYVNGRAYTPIWDFVCAASRTIYHIVLLATIGLLPAVGLAKLVSLVFPNHNFDNFWGFLLGYVLLGILVYGFAVLHKHYTKFINK